MSDIASAYVQIIPSAKGIKGKITEELGGEANSAGKSAGLKIASALKGALAAAGIGKALGAIINEGGKLEQSFGGLDTIYGEASAQAKEFAKQAASAGISANSYAEQAVSFGASLKQAFGGDTTKAVEAANIAIMDMADNSAKMGTDINSIQTAYQGFAKQNYTMLDNLKLGYGGTKTEMERLLKDAQKISGVKYDISNLGDVYRAIHVIQGELGLTGVAAYEASQTLQGSFNAMKASFQNFLGAMATGDNVEEPLSQFIQATSDYLFNNLIPAVVNAIKALPPAMITVIKKALPIFMKTGEDVINWLKTGIFNKNGQTLATINTIIANVLDRFVKNLPNMLQKGSDMIMSLVNGILARLPMVITGIGRIINTILDKLLKALPDMLRSGLNLIYKVAQGILQNLPVVVDAILNVLSELIGTIINHLPEFLAKGREILHNVANGILELAGNAREAMGQVIGNILDRLAGALGDMWNKGREIVSNVGSGIASSAWEAVGKIPGIVSDIMSYFTNNNWWGIGSNIIGGIASGISGAVSGLVGSAIEACRSLTAQVKAFFGISSPSKLMADEVGKYIPEGIALGIEKNMGYVTDAMEELTGLTSGSINLKTSYGAMAEPYYGSGGFVQNITINSPQELSPSEIARQTRNATQQMVLTISGV